MEIKICNNYSSSIQDIGRDIDISKSRWDKLFQYLNSNAESVYFAGNRKLFSDGEFLMTKNFLCEKLLIDLHNSFTVFFRINIASIIINRKRRSSFFEYYELPALFFLNDIGLEYELVERIRTGDSYETIVSSLTGIYAFSKSFEMDVVWLYKSIELEFPEI